MCASASACVLVEELLSGVWYDDVAEAVAGAEL